jgi:8-oxo-dGTP diphosphatase
MESRKNIMDQEIMFSSTTNLLLIKDGQVLLVKRNENLKDFPGWFILPGGKQEKNETPKEAAIREVFEETGIKVNDAVLKVIATHYHEYKSKVYLVYIFESNNFEGLLKESSEGIPMWINIEEALNNPKLFPDLKRHIKLILESRSVDILFTYHRFNVNLEIIEAR